MPEERLQKILSQAGVASRRKAEELIVEGRVSVNGATVTELGSKADLDATTSRSTARLLRAPKHHLYIALNKPKDCVTTVSDPEGRQTVMHLLRGHARACLSGGPARLSQRRPAAADQRRRVRESPTAPASHVTKTYLVKVNGVLTRRAGGAVSRRHSAARPAHRAGRIEAHRARRESLVRSAPGRRPPEPDPHHVQTFRPAGGEAAAGEDRISGARRAEARRLSHADRDRSGAFSESCCSFA